MIMSINPGRTVKNKVCIIHNKAIFTYEECRDVKVGISVPTQGYSKIV